MGASCVDFGNLGRFADSSPVSHPKFPKNSTTSTANTRIFDLDSANQAQSIESTLDSAESAESSPFLSLRNFAKQSCGNPKDLRALRSNHPLIKKKHKIHKVDYYADSANLLVMTNF